MDASINMESENLIQYNPKKEDLVSNIILYLVLLYEFVSWLKNFIAECSVSYSDDRYLIWIVVAVIAWVAVTYLWWRIMAVSIGEFVITTENQSLKIKYKLLKFSFSKNYQLSKIIKLRVIDLGNKIYQVGFNHGDKEDYIKIGRGYSEEKANEILSELKSIIS